MKPISDLNLRGVPTDVKVAFRSLCIARGTTMVAVITQFMRDQVAKAAPRK